MYRQHRFQEVDGAEKERERKSGGTGSQGLSNRGLGRNRGRPST